MFSNFNCFKPNQSDNIVNISSPQTIHNSNYIIILSQSDIDDLDNFYNRNMRKIISKYNIFVLKLLEVEHIIKTNPNIIFNDNILIEKTIYKKFILNDKIYFIQLDSYDDQMFEFRKKSYFQICEALGVKKIVYNVRNSDSDENSFAIGVKVGSNNINPKYKNANSNSDDNCVSMSYNINFSQYISYTPTEFENEVRSPNSHFLINEFDFDNDHNLRCLIRSRLNGNLISSNLLYQTKKHSLKEFGLDLQFFNGFNINYSNNKDVIYTLDMQLEFYAIEELISSDNVKYIKEPVSNISQGQPNKQFVPNNQFEPNNLSETNNPIVETSSNTFAKNKQLFQLLKMRLKYDLNNINSPLYNPYNYIENFLYQYITDNTDPNTIIKFKILSILDKNLYIELIRSIDSFYDIREILDTINKISLDKYFIIKSDDKYNDILFNHVKDINHLLSATYDINDLSKNKELMLNTPCRLLYIYLSNIYTHINPMAIDIVIYDAIQLINLIYKFSSFKEFETYINNSLNQR